MLTLPAQKYPYIVYLKASQAGLVSANSFPGSVVVLMRASPSETIECVILRMPKKHRFEL